MSREESRMRMRVSQSDRQTFAAALRLLNTAGIEYVVAGAFCVHYYTGIWRFTKDMDLFALPEAVPRALEVLSAAGYTTWVEADHWLGKATKGDCLIDIIFGSGNWLAPIDRVWFDRSRPATLFGEPVRMSAVEEMIWAKSYIAGRERFDGADICHLIVATAGNFDWKHLLSRYGEHWELLMSNLALFSFVYPSERNCVPAWIWEELFARMNNAQRHPVAEPKVCRGTLLDRFSFNYDVERWGYQDAREMYAEAQGAKVQDVTSERAWAHERLRKGEVYKKSA